MNAGNTSAAHDKALEKFKQEISTQSLWELKDKLRGLQDSYFAHDTRNQSKITAKIVAVNTAIVGLRQASTPEPTNEQRLEQLLEAGEISSYNALKATLDRMEAQENADH